MSIWRDQPSGRYSTPTRQSHAASRRSILHSGIYGEAPRECKEETGHIVTITSISRNFNGGEALRLARLHCKVTGSIGYLQTSMLRRRLAAIFDDISLLYSVLFYAMLPQSSHSSNFAQNRLVSYGHGIYRRSPQAQATGRHADDGHHAALQEFAIPPDFRFSFRGSVYFRQSNTIGRASFIRGIS